MPTPISWSDTLLESAVGGNVELFRERALVELQRVLPYDIGSFAPLGPELLLRSPESFRKYVVHADELGEGMEKGRTQAALQDGIFIDTEVYTRAQRDKMPFFKEVLRPLGVTSQVVAAVHFRGRPSGLIHLQKMGGRGFSPAALERARSLFAAINLLHDSLVAPKPTSTPMFEQLTPREREVAALAAEGFQNLQIAARLGTSVHTVRRQMEAIFRRLRIGNRTELAVLATHLSRPEIAQPDSRLGRVVGEIQQGVRMPQNRKNNGAF